MRANGTNNSSAEESIAATALQVSPVAVNAGEVTVNDVFPDELRESRHVAKLSKSMSDIRLMTSTMTESRGEAVPAMVLN